MPFLRDDNLTFHRFTTNVSLDSSRRPSNETFAEPSAIDLLHPVHAGHPTSGTAMTPGAYTRPANANQTKSEMSNFAPVWTTAATGPSNASSTALHAAPSSAASAAAAATHPATAIHDPPMYKNSYTIDSHDFHYMASSSRANSVTTTDRRKSMQNGSTAKLMLTDDDQSNKQVSDLTTYFVHIMSLTYFFVTDRNTMAIFLIVSIHINCTIKRLICNKCKRSKTTDGAL